MADKKPIVNVVTGEQLDEMMTRCWQAMKTWVTTNIDNSNLMTQVKETLDECNRDVIGTTATAKVDAVLNSINAIATALRNAGAVVTNETPLAEFATLVRQISTSGYEICILGKSGTHYSIEDWNEYIAQHGSEPEEGVVAVITPFQSFVIGNPPIGQQYVTRQWGNTTDNVQGLYANQTGSFINVLMNSLIFRSLENTYRMLLWYNPEVLPHCNYDPNDPDKDYGAYGCIRFANHAEMENSGQHLAFDQQVYIVTEDTDNTANVCYYWAGNQYTKRFVVPRVANNITGSPAAEYAWDYKAWDGDTRQWALPTINHLLMMYVYYSQINAHLSILNHSTLPTGTSWSCQQYGAGTANYVAIPSANVNVSNKNNTCAVVPVAAL